MENSWGAKAFAEGPLNNQLRKFGVTLAAEMLCLLGNDRGQIIVRFPVLRFGDELEWLLLVLGECVEVFQQRSGLVGEGGLALLAELQRLRGIACKFGIVGVIF